MIPPFQILVVTHAGTHAHNPSTCQILLLIAQDSIKSYTFGHNSDITINKFNITERIVIRESSLPTTYI